MNDEIKNEVETIQQSFLAAKNENIPDYSKDLNELKEINIYTDGKNSLECDDVLKYLKKLESNSTDLIIADPPYFEVYGEFDFGKFKNEKEYCFGF